MSHREPSVGNTDGRPVVGHRRGRRTGRTVGYRGKLEEQERARELRAKAWTLQEIADELGVAKSSVSLWVRDVEFDRTARRSRRTGRRPRGTDHPLRRRKLAEIAECNEWGRQQIGELSERDLLIAGAALYAGEGSKGDGMVGFANTNPAMMELFCKWLRSLFDVDESRLRARLYLHQGLDLGAAVEHWSAVTGIPPSQFGKAYRAVPDPSIRRSKHPYGCATVQYCCTRTHRHVMGLVRALVGVEGRNQNV